MGKGVGYGRICVILRDEVESEDQCKAPDDLEIKQSVVMHTRGVKPESQSRGFVVSMKG